MGTPGASELRKLISISGSEEIRITTASKRRLPPFSPIGRITNVTHQNYVHTDIFDILGRLAKPTYDLFNRIKSLRDPNTNVAFLIREEKPRSYYVMHNTRIRELVKQDIIVKVPKSLYKAPCKGQAYMINPGLVMCPDNQEEALLLWLSIKENRTTDIHLGKIMYLTLKEEARRQRKMSPPDSPVVEYERNPHDP